MHGQITPKATDSTVTSPARFTQTRWSKVMLAGQGDSDLAREALETLCARYWFPVYSFIRRRGLSPHDAEDLTQQFFVGLLEKNALANADRSKGRFRNFLIGALVHFLSNESRKQRTQKRGGGQSPITIDLSTGEERYLLEPDPNLTPEECYDRGWAATLLETAFQRLQAEFVKAGQESRFHHLKAFLGKHQTNRDYQEAAEKLHLTPKSVQGTVFRLRQRYRQLVRMEVAETVVVSDEIEKELDQLFR
jgi:RNA polymerase sigma factor (sigma-70 family)